MMGIVLDRPFPVFPDGFAPDFSSEFSRLTGRRGHRQQGRVRHRDHRRARPRAHAHRRADCLHLGRQRVSDRRARRHRAGSGAVSRLRDRLPAGRRGARRRPGHRAAVRRRAGAFTRTANRHDYALPPFGETLLDRAKAAGVPVVAIGKIEDLFAGRGITRAIHTASDDEGMDHVVQQLAETDAGLIFANLVDFDTQYGHRNDVAGYAANLERFDRRLARSAAAAGQPIC